MTGTVRFLPWVRRGIGAAVAAVDPLGPGLPQRARLPVVLQVDDGGQPTRIRPDVALYGPGDVVGLERSAILRTAPPAGATGTEPTFFPLVEFRAPDLPWLFTPAAADDRGRLRPWLVVAVVPAAAGSEPRPSPDGRLPAVTVDVAELPDLAESWAWAHTQVTGDDPAADPADVLDRHPDRVVSRLLSPRRLDAGTTYRALLVPAFEAGRAAGLGEPVGAGAGLTPAWSAADGSGRVTLPVYHHWTFSTGAAGDFESLLRQLRYRPLPAGVGAREVRVTDPELPDVGVLRMGGALRPAGSAPDDGAPAVLREALRALLDRTTARGPQSGAGEPVVAPPLYGTWQAGHTGLSGEAAPPVWLGELNVEPRHRAAAALGTLVVQDRQRELMAEAWAQVGPIGEVNQLLRRGELAREAGRAVLARRLSRLRSDELFTVTGPVHPNLRLSPETVTARTRASRLPTSATSGAFRRAVRPRGPVGRRSARGDGDDGDSTATGDGAVPPLVAGLADGSLSASPPRSDPRIVDRPESVLGAGQIEEEQASGATGAQRPEGFGDVIAEDRARLAEALGATPPEPGPALPLDDVAPTLLGRLDPDGAAAARSWSHVRGRPVRPLDPLEPFSAAPVFGRPMHAALADLSEDLLLPGLADVPADTMALLETDPSFIEAFLVGLNHEMSRELRWRGHPSDQRATYFRRFWDSGARAPGHRSRLIHEWDAGRGLGGNHPDATGPGQLVLLLRGELLRRYPNAVISAVRARRADDGRREPEGPERFPVFRGGLEPDVTFLGFDLTAAEARSGPDGDPGWFVVISEQATEPRFGLDDGDGAPEVPRSWSEVSWSHVDGDAYATVAGPLTGLRLEDVEWGLNAASMARITVEPPLRVAVHADELLPDGEAE